MSVSLLHPIPGDETGVFSVSELNSRIRSILEGSLPFVWVKGEISNFKIPASGHQYFTLKDSQSQVRAVFFRAQNRRLKFVPEDGLQVVCQGRVSVYEPRGEYQLIVEVMEPAGLGALQLAFEQLKKRLEAEGLFSTSRKRPLPVCPRRIAIVTSPTGAAVRDMLKMLQRSPYPLAVTLLPVRVQGRDAAGEISAALGAVDALCERFGWDLVIVGRGGGSMEDLWPFNEETVARSLASCRVPTVSAVGHEIDFCISDLVADLRAPTPTAAAEWVVARLESLERELERSREQVTERMRSLLERYGHRLGLLEKGLKDPRRRLEDLRLMLDDRMDRLQMAWHRDLERRRTFHGHLTGRLGQCHPARQIEPLRQRVAQLGKELTQRFLSQMSLLRLRLDRAASQLDMLSPLAVLIRGYAIAYSVTDGRIIRGSSQVEVGDPVRVRLGQGALECRVTAKEDDSGGA
ncbi:MAG: exodeoxyribonuclease VII large subunit [Syntrophobacteraceae bacterium]|jgi:exodeoxyribonuclease VII large subunit|nr:exodeoxyribonuclease VII large subunit [Syntrophobacteraceae bacterium]